MPKIQTYHDQIGQRPQQRSRIDANFQGLDAGARALSHAATNISQTLLGKARKEYQELQGAKRINELLEHQAYTSRVFLDVQNDVNKGQVPTENTVQEFRKRMEAYKPTEKLDLSPAQEQNIKNAYKEHALKAEQRLSGFVSGRIRSDYQAEFFRGLDSLSKQAALPTLNNISEINGIADSFLEDAVEAGLDRTMVQRTISQFKEGNWVQHAKMRMIESGNDIHSLQALAQDLGEEQGMYDDKLSIDKRVGLLNSVKTQILRVKNGQQLADTRRDAAAEKTINAIERQISTGVPASPEMWEKWAGVVEGSQYADRFDQLANDEQQVQWVLGLPVSKQQQYIQERDAKLRQGGADVTEINNLSRLRTAVNKNLKLLQNEPLLHHQARTGEIVTPIDIGTILTDSGFQKTRSKFEERITTIKAMQKQYGPEVKMRPLLPQEATFITNALEQGTPRQQADLFAAFRNAIADDQGYMAAMQQIAPDAPVKALAGMIMAKQRSITLERNWFSDDEVTASGNVAETLLLGESILNKTKAQKETDGQAGKFPVPSQIDFDVQFSTAVGDAFAGRPDAYQVAMQAVRSHYVGASAKAGDISDQLNSTRLKYSLKSVLGNVVDLNGNGHVFAPWGMSESEFEDQAESSFKAEMNRRGMSNLVNRFDLFGFKNNAENSYYVMQGKNYLMDGEGRPVVIQVMGE